MTMRWVAALLVLGALGCSDGANTQYNPIGSRCSSNGDCGTKPYNCNTSHPGGYCQKDCATDGDCPTDSLCIALECRRKCSTSADCRSSEGYTCVSTAVSPVCDIASASGDGGI
jgi:hypothetical protein